MICFHKPDEPYGWLSNWYFSDFTVDGIRYSSMEQYMMHQKAVLFEDHEIAEKIMAVSDFGKIKALGRKVKGFSDRVWVRHREKIVECGLKAKFSQNEDLRKKLLNTGDETLAECAVKDRIWAIGLSMKDSRRFNQSSWLGQNLLGKCLMRVRTFLREEDTRIMRN